MSNVRLKKLQIQSFRSFVNTEVDFPESGLVLIRGENPETGDPSGSGKSSLLLAIAYVLDILPPDFPATELQSWKSDVPMQVVLTLTIDGKEVVFGRGKKTFVKIDEEVTNGAKPVMERQKALLGFSPEIVQALTFRAQNTPGLFLSQPPAAKTEFLTSVLGLHAIEDAVDRAEEVIHAESGSADSLKAQLAAAKAELEQLELKRPKVVMPDVEKVKADLEALQDIRKQATAKLNEAVKVASKQEEVAAIEAQLTKSRTFLTDLRAKDRAAEGLIDKQRETLRTNIRNFDTAIAKIAHQLDERKRYAAELAELRDSRCPMCGRDWNEIVIEDAIKKLVDKIALIDKEAEGKAIFERNRAEAEVKLQGLSFSANPAIEKLVAIERKLEADLLALQLARETPTVTALRKELASYDSPLYEAQANLKIAQNQLQTATMVLAQYETQITNLTKKIQKLEADLAPIETRLNVERDFVAMMGREGFLGVIFDDVLREIADEANARLGRLANVSHVSISFQSEAVTQKGKVKKQIGAVVNIDGRQTKLKTGLSGGMLTSVEQVVDLGVMTVISRRAGRSLGWLCLDEVFNGQGAMTKESALEVLSEFAKDRLVLVIDHGSEFKEAFTKTISVEQIGGISKVKP